MWNGDKETFLNALLYEIDNVSGPLTTQILGSPLPLPSLRVKLAIAKRLIATILTEENQLIEDNQANPLFLQTRKRRALSMLIGQLQNKQGG